MLTQFCGVESHASEYNVSILKISSAYPVVLATTGWPDRIKFYIEGIQPLHLGRALKLQIFHFTDWSDIFAEASDAANEFEQATQIILACHQAYPNLPKIPKLRDPR